MRKYNLSGIMISLLADFALDFERVFMQAPGAAILVSKVSRFQGCAAHLPEPQPENLFSALSATANESGQQKTSRDVYSRGLWKTVGEICSRPSLSVSSFLLPFSLLASISSWTIFPLEHRDSGPIDYRQPSTFCIESASDSRYCGSVITLSTRI